MYEHESDILVAEPEEEMHEQQEFVAEQKNTNDNHESSNDLVEMFYKPQQVQENKTIKKQTQTFTNYSNSHLNKVYKKYDVVQTYVPKKQEKKTENKEFEKFVTEQNDFTPQQETFVIEKPAEKPAFRLKQKAKVWLVSFSVIIIMLSALCIINAVNIIFFIK